MGFEEAKGDVKLLRYAPKPMAKNDVDFVVTYNGVCHSDIHMIDNDWGMSRFPLIPGHEVVGHVLAVGDAVTDIAPGDVVGLGAQCQTCKECDYCLKGIDNVCADVPLPTLRLPRMNLVNTFITEDVSFAPRECFLCNMHVRVASSKSLSRSFSR